MAPPIPQKNRELWAAVSAAAEHVNLRATLNQARPVDWTAHHPRLHVECQSIPIHSTIHSLHPPLPSICTRTVLSPTIPAATIGSAHSDCWLEFSSCHPALHPEHSRSSAPRVDHRLLPSTEVSVSFFSFALASPAIRPADSPPSAQRHASHPKQSLPLHGLQLIPSLLTRGGKSAAKHPPP